MKKERRLAQRFKLRVPVGFAGGAVEGRGVTVDLSVSGARVTEVTASVANGATIQLAFGVLDSSFTIRAEVVRQTGDGFAARFSYGFPESVLLALQQSLSSGGQD